MTTVREAEEVRNRTRDQRGLTVIDAVITVCLIGLLFGIVVPKYRRVAHEAQEAALQSELANIRASIKLFKMLIGRNPGSLREMVEKEILLPARTGSDDFSRSVFAKKYLMPHAVDDEGNILDAFGNPFQYDLPRGVVRATTGGYESW